MCLKECKIVDGKSVRYQLYLQDFLLNRGWGFGAFKVEKSDVALGKAVLSL